jgi:hypothetical protein
VSTSPKPSDDWKVLSDEAYVNDIPFDTWKISNVAYPPDLVLDEEGYVNDIPFNTAEIAREALLNKVIELKDESSVNDIPFNTNKIYNEALLSRYIARWQEERNVSDIPFNTCVIVSLTNCGASFRTFYNSDFNIEMKKYTDGFNLKIIGLETLSFEYPF